MHLGSSTRVFPLDFAERGVRRNPALYRGCDLVEVKSGSALQSAFPDDHCPPSTAPEFIKVRAIANYIAVNLLHPEVSARLRDFEQVTIVAVPEASVHKNDSLVLPKRQIWLPGQLLVVKAVTESKTVTDLPHNELGFCILPANAGHVEAASLSAMDVHVAQSVMSLPLRDKHGST